MNVMSTPGGHVVVNHAGKVLAGPFPTNAAAWRALDRVSGEPISSAEKRAAWSASRVSTHL
jgi:hypothetical protein